MEFLAKGICLYYCVHIKRSRETVGLDEGQFQQSAESLLNLTIPKQLTLPVPSVKFNFHRCKGSLHAIKANAGYLSDQNCSFFLSSFVVAPDLLNVLFRIRLRSDGLDDTLKQLLICGFKFRGYSDPFVEITLQFQPLVRVRGFVTQMLELLLRCFDLECAVR